LEAATRVLSKEGNEAVVSVFSNSPAWMVTWFEMRKVWSRIVEYSKELNRVFA